MSSIRQQTTFSSHTPHTVKNAATTEVQGGMKIKPATICIAANCTQCMNAHSHRRNAGETCAMKHTRQKCMTKSNTHSRQPSRASECVHSMRLATIFTLHSSEPKNTNHRTPFCNVEIACRRKKKKQHDTADINEQRDYNMQRSTPWKRMSDTPHGRDAVVQTAS